MNISDQRIIKDFGERFRKSIRKTIRIFDSQLQPLFSVLKEAIVEIFANFIPIQNEQFEKEIIQLCFYKYASKFEDFNFRFVLLALDYIFNNSPEKVAFNKDINYKYLTLIFIEQLKKYFTENQRKSLDNLYQKLELLKKEKEIEDQEEGFYDAQQDDDSLQDNQQNNKFINQNSNQNDTSLYMYTKKDLQDKEELIKQLNLRLQQREKNLIDITTGYMKDLQLLREQLFRKESNQEDSYQVSYMDISEILDPKMRQLLNIHLDELKLQFENKTIDQNKVIDQLKAEIKSLKIQNAYLTNLTKTMDTPFDMISKAFRLEPDPYKLWKIIQDLKGNYYFKEVFENQKPSYGINYREVNNLMMTSKAYEREFTIYKQQLSDSIIAFYHNSLSQIQEIRKELIMKEEELQYEKSMNNKVREQVAQEVQTVMEKIKQDEINQSKEGNNLFDFSLSEFLKTKEMDFFKLRIMYKLWAILTNFKKIEKNIFNLNATSFIEQIKQELICGSFLSDYQKEIQEKLQQILEQNSLLKVQNNELQIKHVQLEGRVKFYMSQIEAIQFEIEEVKSKFQIIYKQKNQIDSEKQLIENYCKQLTTLIDPKMINIRFTDIDLKDYSSTAIQDFCFKIKNLDPRKKNQIKEISEQAFQNNFAFQNLVVQKFFIDQSSQTDLIEEMQDIKEGKKNDQQRIDLMRIQSIELQSDFEAQRISQQIHSNNNNEMQNSEIDPQSQCMISEKKVQSTRQIQQELQQMNSLEQQEGMILSKKQLNCSNERELMLLQEIQQLQTELSKFQNHANQIPNQMKTKGQNQQQAVGAVVNVDLEPVKQETFGGRIHSNQKPKIEREELLQSEGAHLQHNQIRKSSKRQIVAKVDLELSVEGSRSYSRREQRLKDLHHTTQILTNNPLSNFTNETLQEILVDDTKKSPWILKQKKFSKTKENQQKVFERLFSESRTKAEHIKQLKFKLQVLERSHWEDILTIFNNQKETPIEIEKQAENNKIVDQQITEQQQSFQRKTTQNYYEKIKEKYDIGKRNKRQNIYLNWFGRQRIQMERMMEHFDILSRQKQPMIVPSLQIRNKTASPSREYNNNLLSNIKDNRGIILLIAGKSRANTQKIYDQMNNTNAFTFYEAPISLLPTNISEVIRDSRKGNKRKIK